MVTYGWWFAIQTNRRGIERIFSQIILNFHTQASRRLNKIRQPSTCLCKTSNFLVRNTYDHWDSASFQEWHLGRRSATTFGQRYHRQDRPCARDIQDRQEKHYRHLNLTFQDTCVGQQFVRCLNLIQLFRPSRKKTTSHSKSSSRFFVSWMQTVTIHTRKKMYFILTPYSHEHDFFHHVFFYYFLSWKKDQI